MRYLIYDDECNFCCNVVRILTSLVDKSVITYISLKSPKVKELINYHNLQNVNSVIYLDDKGKIYIKAIADSWIEIQKVNSNFFVSKIIKKGEELRLSYEKDLILATSNAGGIIIHIKDKIIDKIGKPGEVIRDISLNYDNLIKFIEE